MGAICKKKRKTARATFHKKGIASKRPFSRNTSSKRHGRRQPCRVFSSCLASKIVLFEVSRSFAPEIFSHTAALRPQEYWMSFKAEKQGVGKRSGQNQILSYETPPKGGSCLRKTLYEYCAEGTKKTVCQKAHGFF